jgi:hypothetical protein
MENALHLCRIILPGTTFVPLELGCEYGYRASMTVPYLLETRDGRPSAPFETWKRNAYSQCGEDGILDHLLTAMGCDRGYFVEFGAWDGSHLSNCAALADRGFAGCFIEGDSERYKVLEAAYPGRTDINRVNAFVTTEGDSALDAILERVAAPKDFTVLSIDIDGMDYHVWESLAAHRPAICVIEFNPTIPAHVMFVQAKDPGVHQGSSLAALDALAQGKGYSLVAATDFNGIFMDEGRRRAAKLPAYRPQDIKSLTYETAFFHGFDATVHLAGDGRLLWHGIPIRADDCQILPAELRRFPVGQPDSYHEQLKPYRSRS